MQKLFLPLLSVFLVAASFSVRAAEQVTISEFMASNSHTLKDEDGQYGDWIELQNSGTDVVNLDGWYLTDSANNLTKWRLPATNIATGGFVIVFADNKDRAVPGAALHANFSLGAGGEYLALVKPDGITIATEFVPTFPGQAPDVSFGFGSFTSTATVINSNSPVRWRIPNGTEGTDWTTTNYDDSAWAPGTNGVGFGNFAAANYAVAILPTAPVAYYRLDETGGTTAANLGSGGASGTYNGVTLGTAGPRPPAFNGFEGNNNAPTFNGSSSYVAGPASLLSGRSAFTVGGWIYPTATPAARTGLFGQNDCVEFGFISGTTLELYTPGGGNLTAVPYPFPLNQWHHVLGVADGSTIRIFLDGQLAGTLATATANYGSSAFNFNIGGGGVQDATGNFFPGLIDEVVVYHRALSSTEILGLYQAGTNGIGGGPSSLVRTDVGMAMSNVNASAYVRIPFVVANVTNISLASLRMQYNDGFIASINGIEVLRVNAPVTPGFNSVATNLHASLTAEESRLGTSPLITGTNILAIQGLNIAANDTNFFVGAEMVLTSVEASSLTPVFFTTPTPGAANLGGIANPGPSIVNASSFPAVPLDSQDLLITAKITPTFYPLSNVVMRYRVMFDAEIEVQMFDDGAHGDGAAADGVFGATIPESASTNGQMIRWYFRATDIKGNPSRWPIFANPAGSAEYLGTVVNPNYVTSSLPIFHLFAAPGVLQTAPPTSQTGADGEGGGRVAIFYDGEFYDNVYMELRGNTSAGQNKKSHRMEFNREHAFRHLPQFPRVRKTSLMAEFLDPTYIRQHLSFWLLEQMGIPSPYFYPVRAQLNGSFYALAFHNDVIDEEQMARMGYDPAGALYKAAGNCLPSESSTGVFQKKTEPLNDHSDYQALVRAINETNFPPGQATDLSRRRAAAFDMLDIPEVVNYLAGARWNAENDDVWANMSLYRDTTNGSGDGLWRIIPFDMNASWGQRYGGITPLDAIADNCKSHPLYGGSTIIACDGSTYNRIYDTIIALPETRQMLLRRQRTILDRWIMEPGVAPESRLLETHIRYMTNAIWAEAFLDRAKWGYSTWTASNKPLNVGVDELFNQFINLRRIHFSATHSITNLVKPIGITPSSNAGIPLTQPANASLQVVSLDYNPASANQAQEFICVSNPSPIALDISRWQLDGAVSFTFKEGTVVPSSGVVYVSPDVVAFRARTTGPRGGQGLFVVGPYKGSLDARGEIVKVVDETGRLVSTNAYVGNPSPAQQYLRITEIMYHPGPTNLGSSYGQEEFEYIELKNIGPAALNLVGIHFTNGIDFAFTAASAVTSLAPGQVILLAKNPAAFISRYGPGTTIAGTYSGSLENSGERIRLDDAVGEQIMDFSYNNSWYPITDGMGFSLVIVNENAPFNTWDDKASWRASGSLNGSPGQDEPAAPVFAPVLVNEVLANSTLPDVDFIELWNSSTNLADISGWWISDDFFSPFKYRVPDNTTIASGGYRVFTEADFNPGGVGFAFSSAGDEAYLFSADASGNLTGYYHGFSFNASEPGVTFGRYVTSDGDEHFVAQKTATINAANSGPKVGPLVISEIMYHPPDVAGSDDDASEFVELQNISSADVSLFDTAYPTNRWKLDDAVNFSFSTNTVVPAGGYLVVVSFDPATNAAALAAFRAKYGIGANVALVGPYGGQLDNSDESVELKKPDTSVLTNITSVLVDRVHYHDAAPWPAVADGFGASLSRMVPGDFGNDVTNWIAGVPTPGAASVAGAPPAITAHPTNLTLLAGGTASFTVSANGSGLSYQWFLNGQFLADATNATLTLNNVQFVQSGAYQAVVLNSGGAVVSDPATLTVLTPIFFSVEPVGQNVLPGTNVTLSSSALGNGPVRYQWQYEGADIPDATNASYSFNNASLDTHGNYRVVATDSLGTVTSSNAFIFVLIRPGITAQPLAQSVVQGGTAVFSITATGAPPLGFRWLRNGVLWASNNFPELVIPNCQSNGSYRCQVVNGAGNANSSSIGLTVLADFDGDGIPDVWEALYGFNTNNAADGLLDSDGDGMNNHDEYVAGTDPLDANSVLKIMLSATSPGMLQFIAQASNSYAVQWRTNLSLGDWQKLSNVPPQSQVRTVEWNAVHPPSEGDYFYRVITPLEP